MSGHSRVSHSSSWPIISPLGKTPVLLVDETPIFELAPRLHPADPLERARHRAWMEFGSAVLSGIAGLYNAPGAAALSARRDELAARFGLLEAALSAGLLFAGQEFSMADAVFAPGFRYFDAFETFMALGLFTQTPKLRAWRTTLAQRPSVREAAVPDYHERLLAFRAGAAQR